LRVLNRAFDHPLECEERAADALAGGLMMHGYQCGMTWGAALAAGAQAYRIHGKGPQAEAKALSVAQRTVESFRAQNKAIDCLEITEIDIASPTKRMIARFLLKSGSTGSCLGMAARYASLAFSEINAAFSEDHGEVPPAPVSCAALLAQKMGASDMHTVMAAGLAGGIGLSGGACGALGAAIWILGLNRLKEGAGEIDLKAPYAHAAIDTFMKCTDYEFECSAIVGRKFEGVGDHAAYVRGGGCSKIIEVLGSLS
jgi:hypothetical protein